MDLDNKDYLLYVIYNYTNNFNDVTLIESAIKNMMLLLSIVTIVLYTKYVYQCFKEETEFSLIKLYLGLLLAYISCLLVICKFELLGMIFLFVLIINCILIVIGIDKFTSITSVIFTSISVFCLMLLLQIMEYTNNTLKDFDWIMNNISFIIINLLIIGFVLKKI